MTSKTLANVTSVVLVACALVVTGFIVRRELFTPAGSAAARSVVSVPGWRTLAAEGWTFGPADAPVKIIEFSDFECPYCAEVQPHLSSLRRKYRGQVAIVFRHFPLEAVHPHALAAAIAAECAGDQGRFEEYHDELFGHQAAIGITAWDDFGRSAGVSDIDEFRACLEQQDVHVRIERDRAAGERIGVRATPSFVYDGKLVAGAASLDQIEAWLERQARE